MKATYIFRAMSLCALCLVGGLFASCGSDDVDESISVIVDSQTPENDLDRWLKVNFVDRYNIEMRYRWEDNEISMDYILVPVSYENAIRMAKVLKYICFDAFDAVTGGPEFIRNSFPKFVQLVGNPGWNTNNTYTLGTSEGGYKINLWYVNHLGEKYYDSNWQQHDVITSREQLNTNYFHTILHEYAHTFHQRVPYSNEFNQISGTDYLGGSYTSVFSGPDDPQIYVLGFVTAYSAYTANEDFAEVFSTYVTSTVDEFQYILDHANADGRNKILRKLRIVHDYFADNWNLDIDALRDEIQNREAHLEDLDFDDLTI